MSKKLKIAIAALLLITIIVSAIHLSKQEEVSCMLIKSAGNEIEVSFEDLDKQDFSGQLIDGKGDVTSHAYSGILIKDLLQDKGIDLSDFSSLTVTSADNYSVVFTREEIMSDGSVYAATVADGITIEGIKSGEPGVQIIVFGDENSRRCVRYAAIIELA